MNGNNNDYEFWELGDLNIHPEDILSNFINEIDEETYIFKEKVNEDGELNFISQSHKRELQPFNIQYWFKWLDKFLVLNTSKLNDENHFFDNVSTSLSKIFCRDISSEFDGGTRDVIILFLKRLFYSLDKILATRATGENMVFLLNAYLNLKSEIMEENYSYQDTYLPDFNWQDSDGRLPMMNMTKHYDIVHKYIFDAIEIRKEKYKELIILNNAGIKFIELNPYKEEKEKHEEILKNGKKSFEKLFTPDYVEKAHLFDIIFSNLELALDNNWYGFQNISRVFYEEMVKEGIMRKVDWKVAAYSFKAKFSNLKIANFVKKPLIDKKLKENIRFEVQNCLNGIF